MNSRLRRFGVESPTTVRAPTFGTDGLAHCPECGKLVETSRGTQRVAHPTVLEEIDLGDEIVVHGWRCERHPSWVVLPSHPDALPEGWVGVEIELADGRGRAVPVPAEEVEA